MKKIKLTQGKFALVDDDDFERLSQHKWHYAEDAKKGKPGYAKRRTPGRGPWIWMHKEIIGAGSNTQVDHIDGNKLNNSKSNLRKCSPTQNKQNRTLTNKNKTGFKGVSWVVRANSWRARLHCNGKERWAGYWKDIKQAALAYDRMAKKHFGQFAKTNADLGLL